LILDRAKTSGRGCAATAAYFIGFLGCGALAAGGLLIRRYISGGIYQSPQYEDVGGGFLLLIHMMIAFGIGAVLGLRLTWIVFPLFGAAERSGGSARRRMGPLDMVLGLLATVLAYLIYLANVG
jgi:hypothetical protein